MDLGGPLTGDGAGGLGGPAGTGAIPLRLDGARAAQVDVGDLALAALGVDEDEDPDAAGDAARVGVGDVHLLAADERDVDPAELARGHRGELAVQVGRGGEPGAG